MESKSTFFILIVIVAVLALALAALAGYLVIKGSSADKENGEAPGADGEQTINIPKEEELIKIPLTSDATYFNLKKTDPKKTSIIQLRVTLKCHKTLKRDKKAVVEDIIAARSEEIQELVVKFFMNLTADEVQDSAMLDKAKTDLARQMNELLNQGEEKPEDIVYNVIFSEWLFQ
ncbi:MAG: flagellar basal body-associated FliL family protein [Clostridiaceae bacterium]|nr:flagellar basal body-associated FliL family protein [Clostridiaceae bacterium]